MAFIAVLMCVNFMACSEDDTFDSSANASSDETKSYIHYQTTDGNILYLENEDVFGGAIITNHTYSTTDSCGTIELSSEITTIDEYAFYKQNQLFSIELPNSVVSIKRYAFRECVNLKSVPLDAYNTIG